MAKSFKEIKAEFKQDMQKNNAKLASSHQDNKAQAIERSEQISKESKEYRAGIEKPNMNASTSGTKKLVALWMAILTAPLFIIGVILFIFAALIIFL